MRRTARRVRLQHAQGPPQVRGLILKQQKKALLSWGLQTWTSLKASISMVRMLLMRISAKEYKVLGMMSGEVR